MRSPQTLRFLSGSPVSSSDSGSGATRSATSSTSDTANSPPATANAAAGPPSPIASPATGAPRMPPKRLVRAFMPWTRTSWSGPVMRGGSAPTAGRNSASTAPKTSATTTSTHTAGPVIIRSAAMPRITAQRTASEPMTTLRGPNRSAITPPPSMRTARGIAPVAMIMPTSAGPPACAAAQPRARK
ncbi:hypothetical protein SSPIM334S_04288 [Streptomyces spiroverticillatus]